MEYTYKDVATILNNIEKKLIKKRGELYYNIACSFDIETTSFYYDKDENITLTFDDYKNKLKKNKKYSPEKRSIMYIWQFAINDYVIFGRTWAEYKKLLDALVFNLGINNKTHLIIYVHNLPYEFQFICKQFEWCNVFADSLRKPMKAESKQGFIYKCSYRLSGYSLAVLAKNIDGFKLEKMQGDLDYKLLRNSKTVISNKELGYCRNDVLIVTAFINSCIKQYGNITKIPLTQTGIVRRYVRNYCRKDKAYMYAIKKMTIEPIEFLALKRAFAGGFTHSNALHTNQTCSSVRSFDFTSSYPAVMCSELYPIGKGKKIEVSNITKDLFDNYLKNYCCLFDIQFYNIKNNGSSDCIISKSKCYNIKKQIENNGRIVSADSLSMTITDVDFRSIESFYNWDSFKISNLYIYKKGFLPKSFIECILTFYEQKTTLKDVSDKEVEYMHFKQMLNSCYGMCVSSPIHDEIDFDGKEWSLTESELESSIDDYNNDKNRFLFYPWGVWVTAYARKNLYSGILECKDDYIYADTDSIKIFNYEKHKDYFDLYNDIVIKKLKTMCDLYNLNYDLIEPETIKGVKKPLGIWDIDGDYKYFKTLGAKRYISIDNENELSVTVAGVSKQKTKDYLLKISNNDIKTVLELFTDNLQIPDTETGKNTHTYIDDSVTGVLVDYRGVSSEYTELSSVHLENATFRMSLSDMYLEYLTGFQKVLKY